MIPPVYRRENAAVQVDFFEEELFLNLDCVMVM